MAYNQLHVLRICQRFKIRVIRISSQPNYLLIQTNRGPKELREWPQLDLMRWSFAWREQLARQGYRNVIRFIRTRDGRPYVIVNNKGYTMNDHVPKTEKLFFSVNQVRQLGQMMAAMHQAQKQKHSPISLTLFTHEQQNASMQLKQAREFHQRILPVTASESKSTNWLAKQLRPLLERMEMSIKLLSAASLSEEILAASHRYLGRDNWALLDDNLVLHGFFHPDLSVQQSDTASMLREMYAEQQDPQWVEAFLDGYEELKPISYVEYQLLLGFLAFPQEPWQYLEYIISQTQENDERSLDEESFNDFKDSLYRQKSTDQLLRQIAARAEAKKGGSDHEPI